MRGSALESRLQELESRIQKIESAIQLQDMATLEYSQKMGDHFFLLATAVLWLSEYPGQPLDGRIHCSIIVALDNNLSSLLSVLEG